MKYQNLVSNYKYRDFKTDHSFVQEPPLIKLCNFFELLYVQQQDDNKNLALLHSMYFKQSRPNFDSKYAE